MDLKCIIFTKRKFNLNQPFPSPERTCKPNELGDPVLRFGAAKRKELCAIGNSSTGVAAVKGVVEPKKMSFLGTCTMAGNRAACEVGKRPMDSYRGSQCPFLWTKELVSTHVFET